MTNTHEWNQAQGLKNYLLILARKAGFVALAWVVVYFLTQWTNSGGIQMLFAPVIGAAAGVAIGWYLAEDAVEDAGFSSLLLYVLLVLAAWLSIWIVEGVLGTIMSHLAKWHLDFGRYMLIMSAMILSFAAAVWRASADG